MPSVKPATPPGDGDTGSDSHCAANTIGTSISATATPAHCAARAQPRTATNSSSAAPA